MNIVELLTPGMLLFAAGIGLFVLAVVLIIVFCLRPPRYTPENEAVAMAGSGQTQPLRSSYQTNRLGTTRGGQTAGQPVQTAPPAAAPAAPSAGGTASLAAAEAPAAPQAPAAAWQGALAEQPPAPGTAVLSGTQPETAVLSESQPGTEVLTQPGTEVLPPQGRP